MSLVAVETEVTEDRPDDLVEDAVKEAEKKPVEQTDDMCANVLDEWIRQVRPSSRAFVRDLRLTLYCYYIMDKYLTIAVLHNYLDSGRRCRC